MTFSRAIPSAQPPYWLVCWAVAWWVVMRVSRFGCSTWDGGDSGCDIHRASQHFKEVPKEGLDSHPKKLHFNCCKTSWKVKLSFQGIWVELMKHDLFPQNGESFDETKNLKSSTCSGGGRFLETWGRVGKCQAAILIFLNLGHHN